MGQWWGRCWQCFPSSRGCRQADSNCSRCGTRAATFLVGGKRWQQQQLASTRVCHTLPALQPAAAAAEVPRRQQQAWLCRCGGRSVCWCSNPQRRQTPCCSCGAGGVDVVTHGSGTQCSGTGSSGRAEPGTPGTCSARLAGTTMPRGVKAARPWLA